MSPTISDVAARAGVSPSTVSRVLNGRPGISEETRLKVLQAAKELGYYPAMAGRGLALGQTENLGFITHHRQTLGPGSFYGEILAGVDKEVSTPPRSGNAAGSAAAGEAGEHQTTE